MSLDAQGHVPSFSKSEVKTYKKMPGLVTWRIIPVSKWLVTPIYKPFSPFGRGITLLRDRLTMVINHLLNGMILQVPISESWSM